MWYVFKVYVLPNDVPAVHWVEQALAAKPKGLETIFMGDLNSHLRNPCNKREEELETALALTPNRTGLGLDNLAPSILKKSPMVV